MPIYSFGVHSPLKFELTEEYADAYNRAMKAFYEAQMFYRNLFGTRWVPTKPLWIRCSDEDMLAFNAFKPILEEALKKMGRPVHEDEIMDDYLIRN